MKNLNYDGRETRQEISLVQAEWGVGKGWGWFVDVEGEGVERGTCLGLGIIKYLAQIPKGGLSEDIMEGTLSEIWLERELAIAGLVEKRDKRFYRTEAAERAKYFLKKAFTKGRASNSR